MNAAKIHNLCTCQMSYVTRVTTEIKKIFFLLVLVIKKT